MQGGRAGFLDTSDNEIDAIDLRDPSTRLISSGGCEREFEMRAAWPSR